jgi:hypothetical protein
VSTVEFDESSISELGEAGAAKVETAEVAGQQPAPPPAAPVPAAKLGQIYTVMAREGVNAAQLVNTALKKRNIGKLAPRRVEVVSPNGPSTSGGKKARQSITLAPISGHGAAIVLGFLDVAQKTAELRDYAFVAQQHRARFGAPFDASAEDYQALTKELSNLLGTLGFNISAIQEEDEEALPAPSESELPGTSKRTLVLVAAGVAVALTIVLILLRS